MTDGRWPGLINTPLPKDITSTYCRVWPRDINNEACTLFQLHGLVLYIPLFMISLVASYRILSIDWRRFSERTAAAVISAIQSFLYVVCL
jgi:hypothetical protein